MDSPRQLNAEGRLCQVLGVIENLIGDGLLIESGKRDIMGLSNGVERFDIIRIFIRIQPFY